MTREISKADLARIVAVCPSLRYVDLPEGFFTADPSCNTLRIELQARCPEIRKMRYNSGAESGIELLAEGHHWPRLEVLELTNLNTNPMILRRALAALSQLKRLKIKDMQSLNDEFFYPYENLPPFPPFTELIFEKIPNITAAGLEAYLFRSDTQEALKSLSFTKTGVHPSTLDKILAIAPKLTFLSLVETVLGPLSVSQFIPLSSTSLLTLHYEITSNSSPNPYNSVTASYYNYLTRSLLAGKLPALRSVYVRDPNFPESLLELAPPAPLFASEPDRYSNPFEGTSPTRSEKARFSSNNPFAKAASLSPFLSPKIPSGPGLQQELSVYSKGFDEQEWNFCQVQPASPGRRGSMTKNRPMSSYSVTETLDKDGNKVAVGNGFGGWLAVPREDEQRPKTSWSEKDKISKKKRKSQIDIWR